MDENIKKKTAEKAERPDANLDEGLDETFPASDAPAATQPGSGRRDEERDKTKPRE